MITALAGGVGAAKFLTGLVKCVPEEELTIIINTGDDVEMFGLHVSPDIDIVTYTLAGIVDEDKGWGIKNDTFQCLDMLRKLGLETWFNLGDRDFATSICRTELLRRGFSLSKITDKVCSYLGVGVKILPMTNDPFETKIRTLNGLVHFEEYFVKNQSKDEILGIEFPEAATAKPAEGVLEAILESKLVIICPSNPIVSIGTILSIKGIKDALMRTNARVVAVSPIVAGAPIKGPADKLLRRQGCEVSAYGVAKFYSDFVDMMVIDSQDAEEKSRIEQLGIEVKVTNTIMKSLDDKVKLAKAVLDN